MDWMEKDPSDEWDGVAEQSIDAARAQAVHGNLRSARLPPLSSNLLGLHETAYQLKIYYGRGSCEFNWSREPPNEWHALGEVAQEVRAMADEILGVEKFGGR